MGRVRKVNSNVGQICQMKRLKTTILQKEVSEETGYSVQTISAFETGKMRSMDLLVWYILNFGVSVEDLRGCIQRESRTD